MQKRLSTTVVTIVGAGADAAVQSLDDARNVRTLRPSDDEPPAQRAMTAWQQVGKSRSLYTVHDADPLESVVTAWMALFEGGARGDLEVAVTEALARQRSDTIGLPDFYLVVDPEILPTGRRDWYLGVLHRAAPHRVVPVEPETELIRAALASLPHGPWWPEFPKLLDGLELILPDQPMVSSAATSDILS